MTGNAADWTGPESHEPTVVRAALAAYHGRGDAAELLAAFRGTGLWVHRKASPAIHHDPARPGQGSHIQVFTSWERLRRRVGVDHHLTLLGAEVLDVLLPHLLPAGTGVLLDPGSPHMIAIPPDAETRLTSREPR